MKRLTLFAAFLVFSSRFFAQDTYHTNLVGQLTTEYAISNGTWILPNTETETLSGASTYGASVTNLTITGQPFTQARRFVITQGNFPYSSGHLYSNKTAIASGDRCLLVFWLRSTTPLARVSLFAENSTTYSKEHFSTVQLTDEWRQYLVPFQSTAAYPVGTLNIGLHLAWLNQTVEIGGIAALNFKQNFPLSQLPIVLHNDFYDGQQPDAAWRAEAAASIEQIRKANLNLVVTNSGTPVDGAQVRVEMLQHEFGFGSAVVSNKFNGGSAQNNTYEQKLLNIDGNGHGFSEVVFENDLKWDGWEQHWYSSQQAIASDLAWLNSNGIRVRGHNLVWPGWQYMPDDMEANKTNPGYLKNKIRNHLIDILGYPGVGTACVDWDVLNEVTANTDLANALAGTPGYTTGREIYTQIFKQADSLAPNTKLYLNDYVAIERGDNDDGSMALWKTRIDELVAAGAPIEGIGFQGHFGVFPTGIPKVKAIYDDFYNTYGLEAKVTEYDVDLLVPPATQADYMRDILTVTFAHPSMKGFLMWGFWDGAHWLSNAPLFNTDWTLKPSGEAFIDQVYNKWWTDSTFNTGTNGTGAVRGFKGRYKVVVSCGNTLETRYITLDGDTTLTIDLNCIVGTADAIAPKMSVEIAPSIVQDDLHINWQYLDPSNNITLIINDLNGKTVYTYTVANPSDSGTHQFNAGHLAAGTYILTVQNGRQQAVQKFVVIR